MPRGSLFALYLLQNFFCVAGHIHFFLNIILHGRSTHIVYIYNKANMLFKTITKKETKFCN